MFFRMIWRRCAVRSSAAMVLLTVNTATAAAANLVVLRMVTSVAGICTGWLVQACSVGALPWGDNSPPGVGGSARWWRHHMAIAARCNGFAVSAENQRVIPAEA